MIYLLLACLFIWLAPAATIVAACWRSDLAHHNKWQLIKCGLLWPVQVVQGKL